MTSTPLLQVPPVDEPVLDADSPGDRIPRGSDVVHSIGGRTELVALRLATSFIFLPVGLPRQDLWSGILHATGTRLNQWRCPESGLSDW